MGFTKATVLRVLRQSRHQGGNLFLRGGAGAQELTVQPEPACRLTSCNCSSPVGSRELFTETDARAPRPASVSGHMSRGTSQTPSTCLPRWGKRAENIHPAGKQPISSAAPALHRRFPAPGAPATLQVALDQPPAADSSAGQGARPALRREIPAQPLHPPPRKPGATPGGRCCVPGVRRGTPLSPACVRARASLGKEGTSDISLS